MTVLESTPVVHDSVELEKHYVVKRRFFPSHGRLTRRVNHRLENGQRFIGFIPSFWWGPLCAFLVYAKPERERPGLGLS